MTDRAVMLSIKPKYCELIASGKKIFELRKNKPKLQPPFKCYIYCTKESYKGKYLHTSNQHGKLLFWHNPNDTTITVQPEEYDYTAYACGGKVVGEFVCDKIVPVSVYYSGSNDPIANKEFPFFCLTDKEIMDYLGNGVQGWGWHISDFVLYDEPKELSKFRTLCNGQYKDCRKCGYFHSAGSESTGFFESCCFDGVIPLTRPPQSWCYVQEVSNHD